MKVIFVTNVPSPYRVDFFNELGKHCDLTVLYERASSAERDSKWKGAKAENYEAMYLDLKPCGVDFASGSAVKDYVRTHQADFLFFTNYPSPATREAIIWCWLHGRKYYIEYDGGFFKRDPLLKRLVKKFLLCGAAGHFTTADLHVGYLQSLGIAPDKIFKYPFTSVKDSDLLFAEEKIKLGKSAVREKLNVEEQHMILTVGRFSNGTAFRKGYDLLMAIAEKIGPSVGFYFVGEEPPCEYVEWKQSRRLSNVHFVGFKSKLDLAEYYVAADLFVLLTREDIWGLVINEAMSFGLPVITTNTCIAGLELIDPELNGYLADYDNQSGIIEHIKSLLADENARENFGRYSLNRIKDYTISKMSQRHMELFNTILEQRRNEVE